MNQAWRTPWRYDLLNLERMDLNLDKLFEQADVILEIAPFVSNEKEKLAVLDPPKKELKPLKDNLKNKFLGPTDSLLVIIASALIDA